jgi:hypothetical protein
MNHVDADLRQQLVEKLLTVLEVIVERSLRDAGLLGDAGNGGLGLAILADDPGGGLEYPLLGPGVAFDPVKLGDLARCCLRRLRHA